MGRLHGYTHRSVLVQSFFVLLGPSSPPSHILFLPSQDEQSGPLLSRLVTRTKEYNMWAIFLTLLVGLVQSALNWVDCFYLPLVYFEKIRVF